MHERLTLRCQSANSLSDVTAALEQAAIAHSVELHTDFDRMLRDYGVMWMIARMRLTLTRLPQSDFSVTTFLRKPSSLVSIRDFTLSDGTGELGTAAQTWVLADAVSRRLVPIRSVPILQDGPFPQPERTDQFRRLSLPPTGHTAVWNILPGETDRNGHLNNVSYIRHAEALAPEGCTGLEILFERECFAGEALHLETAEKDSFYVRGVKENGEESFRARLWKENAV